MNAYLITYKGKQYCTNADNIELAEEKFADYFLNNRDNLSTGLDLQEKEIDARINIEVISDVKGKNVEFF
jgi:hypothetical protein